MKTTIAQQIKAIESEVQMYASRMTWHEHQQALEDAAATLKSIPEQVKPDATQFGNNEGALSDYWIDQWKILYEENQQLREQLKHLEEKLKQARNKAVDEFYKLMQQELETEPINRARYMIQLSKIRNRLKDEKEN